MSEQQRITYLDIAGWDENQPEWEGSRPWVKDYTETEGSAAYSKLTGLQRYILVGLTRLRGRFAQRIDNDPTFIAQALCMVPRDRPHIAQSIRTLHAQGFLVLCNQQIPKQSKSYIQSKDVDEQVELQLPTGTTGGNAYASHSSNSVAEDTKTLPSHKGYEVSVPPVKTMDEKATPPPPASTAPAPRLELDDIRDWPEAEQRFGITGTRLRNCILFQLDVKGSQWYLEKAFPTTSKMNSKGYVLKLDADTPPGWHPDIKRKTAEATPKVYDGLLDPTLYKADKPCFD